MPQNEENVSELVEHLFRHQSGKMLATLIKIFGAEHLEIAEDVVQDTLLTALKIWTFHGIPPNPPAWLMQVSKNKALDILRRQSNLHSKIPLLARDLPEESQEAEDDELKMLFMGCHPNLSQEMQVALLLKTLGGFSVPEIARAFLEQEATIAQRIVRAKRKIRDSNIVFSLPSAEEQASRLDSVLLILYLIFNEGYKASEGDNLVRQDLCAEAIRLCRLLLRSSIGNTPESHALMALMRLQASRLQVRDSADLLLLEEQDRSLWDKQAIAAGIYHLDAAAQGNRLSLYHLQAGIAACHALAPRYEATDWAQILHYYEQWLELAPSPLVRLNRAVVLAMLEGAEGGLQALAEITGLEAYYLFYACRAEFSLRLGRRDSARQDLQTALNLAENKVERRFLEKKLAALEVNN